MNVLNIDSDNYNNWYIQRGTSGNTSYSIHVLNSAFGNVLVFGGDRAKHYVLHIFYDNSATNAVITPIVNNSGYTFTATYDSTTGMLTLSSTSMLYGGITFIQ